MAVKSIGDRVKVINQDVTVITGTVVEDWGNKVVVIDDDAETLDDRLEFKKSDLEELEESDNDWRRIIRTIRWKSNFLLWMGIL